MDEDRDTAYSDEDDDRDEHFSHPKPHIFSSVENYNKVEPVLIGKDLKTETTPKVVSAGNPSQMMHQEVKGEYFFFADPKRIYLNIYVL